MGKVIEAFRRRPTAPHRTCYFCCRWSGKRHQGVKTEWGLGKCSIRKWMTRPDEGCAEWEKRNYG
jgi:hypothetical protein